MRIKQLQVTRYGPMHPFSESGLGDFTLFHGPNEQGKTLLIDALIRLLFKKDLRKTYRRYFGNMNRVNENPEGFVVLESKGVEHKLEQGEAINSDFPFDITPEDFRNVFVVRDSDLTLEGADRYYSRVTEKLTGLRSSEIENLMRAIQKRGRLRSARSDSDLANSVDQAKIASKVRYGKNLVDEIRELRELLLADKYDDLENELIDIRDRSSSLETEATLQRLAEETKKFSKAKRALSDLKRMKKLLIELDRLDASQLKDWQKAISRREGAEVDLAEEKREADKVERAIRNNKRELNALEAKCGEVRNRLNRINSDLKPKIDDYQYERAEFRRAEPQSGTYRKGLYAAAGMTALALFGYLVHASVLIAGIGIGAFLIWIFLGIKQLKLRTSEGSVRSKMDVLLANAKSCGLEVETADEVISRVSDFEQQVAELEQDLQAHKADLENTINEKRRIEGRINGKSEQIAELDAEIVTIKVSTGMESIGDYQAAIEQRTKLEASAGAIFTILRDMLPTEATGDAAIDEWRVRIDAILQNAEEEKQVEFDARALERINAELVSLEGRKRNIQSALLQGSRKLHGVEVKAKELGVLETSPPCRTTQELDHIGTLIADFCDRIAKNQRVAQDCIRLCEKIEAEERERVSDLFGEDSPISSTFSAITDGRYKSVHYDSGNNSIYLIDSENERVRADSLSGGAYDQLFLTIRVFIASKLLGDESGFLILDDPFIKADSNRLPRLMEVLRDFSGKGWQILYFSAKEEITRVLSRDIEDGRVRKIKLEAPSSKPAEPAEPDDPVVNTGSETESDDSAPTLPGLEIENPDEPGAAEGM
jgi:exonuclease SbcC